VKFFCAVKAEICKHEGRCKDRVIKGILSTEFPHYWQEPWRFVLYFVIPVPCQHVWLNVYFSEEFVDILCMHSFTIFNKHVYRSSERSAEMCAGCIVILWSMDSPSLGIYGELGWVQLCS